MAVKKWKSRGKKQVLGVKKSWAADKLASQFDAKCRFLRQKSEEDETHWGAKTCFLHGFAPPFSLKGLGLEGVFCKIIYSQTELDLQSHRCIVNKQKSSLSSAQGFIDAMLRNVLHSSNNNFPKVILFDYNSNGARLEMLSITLGRQGRVLHVEMAHAVQGLEKALRFE